MFEGFSKLLRRRLAFILVLTLLVTLFYNPPDVMAEDSTMTITGYIRDELGQPVIGSYVYLEYVDPGSNAQSTYTTTNGEGKYSFEPMYINSEYLLKEFRIRISNPGVPGEITERVDNFKYGTYPYDFTVIRYGTTVIRLHEETGATVPAGVPMWFSYVLPDYNDGWPWNAPADGVTPHYVTGSGGNIQLRLRASWCYDGVVDVDAHSLGGFNYGYAAGQKGYGGIDQTYNMTDRNGVNHTSDLRYELTSNTDLRSDMIDVSSQAGKTRELDFYIRALGKVTAAAKDANNSEPVQGAMWNYSSTSGFTKYGDYSDDGSEFSIYGYGKDTITVVASDPADPAEGRLGHQSASAEVNVTPWGVEAVSLMLQPNSPGIISGRVTNTAGQGIEGAMVRLLWPNNEEYFAFDGYDRNLLLKSTVTDSNGYYSFTGVVPTNGESGYIIQASKDGYKKDTAYDIGLESGQTKRIDDLVIDLDSTPPAWNTYDRLTAVSVGWSGITLQWPVPHDDTSIKEYKVYCGDTLVAESGYKNYYNTVRYTVNNLQPATNYSFFVKAYDDAGNVSEPLSVSTTTAMGYNPALQVIRASVNSEGLEASAGSRKPAISADGRFMAFESGADNLYAKDSNNREDIFLTDRNTGLTKCISLAASGKTGNGSSRNPTISADGRYVVFASDAADLTDGDTNGRTDICLYDTVTQQMERVSTGIQGVTADNGSDSPSISAEGQYVVFSSDATNLVQGDSNGSRDIFLRDRTNGTINKVSCQPNGDPITGSASNPVISANGQFVSYEVYSGYINAIYIYDVMNGTTELVTKSYSDPATACRGYNSSISADGHYVAFYSGDNRLVASDSNGKEDVFVYDRIAKVMQLVSVSSEESQGNNYSTYPSISADGRFVAFKSMAGNLVPEDTNGCYDVFVRDRVEGTTERVSVSAEGTEGDGDSSWEECSPSISADGSFIAYDSYAANLVDDDWNDALDIFIFGDGYVVQKPTIALITAVNAVAVSYGTSEQQAVAALPQTTTIKDSSGQIHTVHLTWTIANYNGNTAGNYTAQGTFALPEGVAQTDPETALKVTSTLTVSAAPVDNSSTRGETAAMVQNAILTAGTQTKTLNVTIDNANRITWVSLNQSTLNSAFNMAKTIKIQMPVIPDTNTYALELPAGGLSSVNGDRRIEFACDAGTITLSENILQNMRLENTSNIRISIGNADKTKLTGEIQQRLGEKPFIELKITEGSRALVWNNPDTPVTVSIPYTPLPEEVENTEHITVWCMDKNGNVSEVTSGRYDPAAGKVIFHTSHFGKYAVACVTKSFEDLQRFPWARKQIEVLASKGIVKGVTEKEYAPQKDISRADFLYSLIRTLGIDAEADENFDDIDQDAYYYKEIAIAKKLGITAGTGNNRFSPDACITRQDMMVLVVKTLRILKKLTQDSVADVNMFADNSLISEYAKESVAIALKEELIVGSGSRINPLKNTTRAEAAVLLYKIYNKY